MSLRRGLEGCCLPNEICVGFYENLGERGFEEKHLQALFDCGLVEYQVPSDVDDPSGFANTISVFSLTREGKHVVL
jgi:hypothetical protein